MTNKHLIVMDIHKELSDDSRVLNTPVTSLLSSNSERGVGGYTTPKHNRVALRGRQRQNLKGIFDHFRNQSFSSQVWNPTQGYNRDHLSTGSLNLSHLTILNLSGLVMLTSNFIMPTSDISSTSNQFLCPLPINFNYQVYLKLFTN